MSTAVAEFKLMKDERHAVFAGTLKTLRRLHKPDQEAGAKVVVGWSRAGRQILDRDTGETIEIEREPRLWITIKGWHLRAGSTEWETSVTVHDRREHHRALANGIGGIPREAGLRTRWGTHVIHSAGEVKTLPKRVPKKDEQREHWTSETERGYGGRGGVERDSDGELQPSGAVDDATLAEFARQVEEENQILRHQRRAEDRKLREEFALAEEVKRGCPGKLRQAQIEREARRAVAA